MRFRNNYQNKSDKNNYLKDIFHVVYMDYWMINDLIETSLNLNFLVINIFPFLIFSLIYYSSFAKFALYNPTTLI